jgi:hypothetical protein
MKTKITARNFKKVLENIIKQFEEAKEKQVRQLWIDDLNDMLDNMRDNDFFGTEGQCDPRGDNRD